ncbi:MAG TPA: phosphohistidine phosphatase SixA [Caldilineaceae bacterium]|nr:phosphohistidine phosphatase SixA [Caldilineaceae bacterium]
MKHITILRHGKASQDPRFSNDFDRPLTDKGRKQLPRVAAFIGRSKVEPDWIVSSPALRAKETAEQIADNLGTSRPIVWNERAYLASAITLLEILRETPDIATHLVLVGHNPGMSDLAAGLCAGGDFRLNLQMPTAGVATLAAQVVHWRQLRWGCAELLGFVAPRFIKGLG